MSKPTQTSNGVERRAILQGAAWSVPAVAVALAAPASAASTPCASGYVTPAPAMGGAAGASVTWDVPAGVTSLSVTVTGGGGGRGETYPAGSALANGGSGAKITATFAVTPGETLTLITGQGGLGDGSIKSDATRFALSEGGGGYGKGGDTQPISNNFGADASTLYTRKGGSGGGGSAILRGIGATAVPLIVAGGGGGGGTDISAESDLSSWTRAGFNGANGDMTAPQTEVTRNSPNVTTSAWGGDPGAPAGPGDGGVGGLTTSAVTLENAAGLNGSGSNPATGANGANGVPVNYPHLAAVGADPALLSAGSTSGAGGGGYTGGGSGGAISSGDTYLSRNLLSAGGGGGSSYVGAGVDSFDQDAADNAGTQQNVRLPGSITITWAC